MGEIFIAIMLILASCICIWDINIWDIKLDLDNDYIADIYKEFSKDNKLTEKSLSFLFADDMDASSLSRIANYVACTQIGKPLDDVITKYPVKTWKRISAVLDYFMSSVSFDDNTKASLKLYFKIIRYILEQGDQREYGYSASDSRKLYVGIICVIVDSLNKFYGKNKCELQSNELERYFFKKVKKLDLPIYFADNTFYLEKIKRLDHLLEKDSVDFDVNKDQSDFAEDKDLIRQAIALLSKGSDTGEKPSFKAIRKTLEEIEEKLDRENSLDKLHPVRKMYNYYLPSFIKMVSIYRYLEDKDKQMIANVKTIKKEILESIKQYQIVFEKILNSLYEKEKLDIQTDLSVLNTIMIQDGYLPSKINITAETSYYSGRNDENKANKKARKKN